MKIRTIHPRPNPIVAAMYTLRDMDVDVLVVHGPSGCSFMASRMLEEADVRVVTTSIRDSDLIFGASESLVETLKSVKSKFDPKTVAVIGTCASMIIGEDMVSAVKQADIGCTVITVDCHGCMGDNTRGAIKAIEAARDGNVIDVNEAARQIDLMKEVTRMEKNVGMAGKEYLSPVRGPTKLAVSKMIIDTLRRGKKVAVVMNAKKELAYRFADIFLAVNDARAKCGGETVFLANLDTGIGLPRIRRYAEEITSELKDNGITIDHIIGGLDEYVSAGLRAKEIIDTERPDLLVLVGMPHAYPDIDPGNDIMITDQPRQLANYLNQGCELAVGEISSHSMVMGAHSIIPLETGDTIRELLR